MRVGSLQVEKQQSNLTFPLVDIQFAQYHLLKTLASLLCLASLSKLRCPYVYGLISGSDSIPLINMSLMFGLIPCWFYYYSSVVQLEVSDRDISRFVFCFHMKLKLLFKAF